MAVTPQECPNPKCGVSLADPGVPEEYSGYSEQFTLALTDSETKEWVCPVCKHRWPRIMPSRKMRRVATKELRKRVKKGRR